MQILKSTIKVLDLSFRKIHRVNHGRLTRYVFIYPFSFRLKKVLGVMMIWSRNSIPSSIMASCIRFVIQYSRYLMNN